MFQAWFGLAERMRRDALPDPRKITSRGALQKTFGPEHEVELIIRDLPDADMLRIMADENMEEWSHNSAVTVETVRAVVTAFANGKIDLEAPSAHSNTRMVRKAPKFKEERVSRPGGQDAKLYTSKTLAKFLGWNEKKIDSALGILPILQHNSIGDGLVDAIVAGNMSSCPATTTTGFSWFL